MIAFIGDSLVRGISMVEALGQPFCAVWADRHNKAVQNFGLGGDQTGSNSSVYAGGGKQRLLDLVLPHGMEEGVYIGLGINNVIAMGSAAIIAADLSDMIQSCITAGVPASKIVVAELAPWGGANGTQNTIIADTNVLINALPTTYVGVKVAHLHSRLRDAVTPTNLLAAYDSGDHLHWSAAGHVAVADELDEIEAFGLTT